MRDVKESHKHICNDQALSGKERESPRLSPRETSLVLGCSPGGVPEAGMFEGSRVSA